jgi:hypothetical protein
MTITRGELSKALELKLAQQGMKGNVTLSEDAPEITSFTFEAIKVKRGGGRKKQDTEVSKDTAQENPWA